MYTLNTLHPVDLHLAGHSLNLFVVVGFFQLHFYGTNFED